MDFLTDDLIMHGGEGWKTGIWLIVSIVYLAVSIALWWVYYFYFEDRRRIGESNDGKDKSNLVLGQTGTFIGFCIVAALIFWTGLKQDDTNISSSPLREYFLLPLAWLSIGVQLGLVLSMATPDDWNKLKEETQKRF